MYGDQKLVDEIKHQLYHAIWNAQNSLGEELAAEVIVHAFGNPDALINEINLGKGDVDLEPKKTILPNLKKAIGDDFVGWKVK
jgi:hypothetical protein